MKLHIEEAWRALRLADRDLKVFDILAEEPDAQKPRLWKFGNGRRPK
jgi:hypothetical protein